MQRPACSAFGPSGFAAYLALTLAACTPGSSADDPVSVVRPNEEGGEGPDAEGGAPTPPRTPAEILYELPPAPGCGDFTQDVNEACDDGNRDNGDGCSGNCLVVENGFACPVPGAACEPAEVCGDSRRILTETCDDGNDLGGDGCSTNCRVENGYVCPQPGEACVSSIICGDGFVALSETCDDANTVAGDGCSATCQLEGGFQCTIAGANCGPVCGDGLLIAPERCDDGNVAPGDGCSDICRLEPGSACDVPGGPCRDTVCADGVFEGTEQCDDGNTVPYDGCTADCVNEPRCGDVGNVYTCVAVCGDGMKFPEEACDDGNTLPDDGCSPTCALEGGYACTNQAADFGDALALPIIYRDFQNAHPHFEIDPLVSPRLPGIVESRLGPNGKPVYNQAFTFPFQNQNRPWTMDGPQGVGNAIPLASAAPTLDQDEIADLFGQWYTDVPGQNQTIVDTLLLVPFDLPGSFQFSAAGVDQFFPIDGLGFGNQGNDITGAARNFHFTSEVRQWFLAEGGEVLQFRGDDDVWVFVNGELTVDLGGIHGEISGSIALTTGGNFSLLCLQDTFGGPEVCEDINVPISANVNEIVVFQAERHVTESNYTLTLRGFNAPVTTCASVCGDGTITPDETCDDGPLNGTGYDQCNANCTPGPRCGDGELNGPEQCDNGVNRDGYLLSADSCAPGCVTPSSCGDAEIDAAFGEQCDDGVNDNAYGGCSPECLLGPRCGDGITNGVETCDDGNRRNTDGCDVNCAVERDPA